MIGKIYFIIVASFLLFGTYYEFKVTGLRLDFFNLVSQIIGILILVGAFSYYFKKTILDSKKWKIIFWAAIINQILSFLIQVLPKSYLGNFSLLNANLLTNIFIGILGFAVFIPLYVAVYRLGNLKKKK